MDTNPTTAPVAQVAAVAPTAVAPRIRKVENFLPVTLSRVYVSNYQKEGTRTAELKQIVETKSYYPSKSVTSNLQDNPFSNEEFGFEEHEYTDKSTRTTWINVPVGSTEAVVQAKLDALPNKRVYRILANRPILSQNQLAGIEAGLTSKEVIADTQAVRYPNTAPAHQAGKLILDTNGKPQYKANFFRSTMVPDEDLRTADPKDYYATAKITLELANRDNVHVGQEETL